MSSTTTPTPTTELPTFEFERSYSGRVLLEGRDIQTRCLSSISRSIGYRLIQSILPENTSYKESALAFEHLIRAAFLKDADPENKSLIMSSFLTMSKKETCNTANPVVNAMVVAVVWYWQRTPATPQQNATSAPPSPQSPQSPSIQDESEIKTDEEIESVWRSYTMHSNLDPEAFSCWLQFFQSILLTSGRLSTTPSIDGESFVTATTTIVNTTFPSSEFALGFAQVSRRVFESSGAY